MITPTFKILNYPRMSTELLCLSCRTVIVNRGSLLDFETSEETKTCSDPAQFPPKQSQFILNLFMQELEFNRLFQKQTPEQVGMACTGCHQLREKKTLRTENSLNSD